jgi:hypothetical protein
MNNRFFFPAHRAESHSRNIVVDVQRAVLHELRQSRPTFQGVIIRLAKQPLRQSPSPDQLHGAAQPSQYWLRLRDPHGLPKSRPCFFLTQLFFHHIKQPDLYESTVAVTIQFSSHHHFKTRWLKLDVDRQPHTLFSQEPIVSESRKVKATSVAKIMEPETFLAYHPENVRIA